MAKQVQVRCENPECRQFIRFETIGDGEPESDETCPDCEREFAEIAKWVLDKQETTRQFLATATDEDRRQHQANVRRFNEASPAIVGE